MILGYMVQDVPNISLVFVTVDLKDQSQISVSLGLRAACDKLKLTLWLPLNTLYKMFGDQVTTESLSCLDNCTHASLVPISITKSFTLVNGISSLNFCKSCRELL